MSKWLKLTVVLIIVGITFSSVQAEPQYIDPDGCTGSSMTREWSGGGWTIMWKYC